jgi:hypothetical protein
LGARDLSAINEILARKPWAEARMRKSFLILLAIAAFGVGSAFAAAPDKDKLWDALIAQAKAHGGAETVLDRSASYVFQAPDGSFVTLTRVLGGSKRAVCLIAKDQMKSMCVNWDTGETTFGERAGAASPWKTRAAPPIEEVWANQPGPFQTLMSGFLNIIGTLGGGMRHGGFRTSGNGNLYYQSN